MPFNPNLLLKAKVELLEDYFQQFGINAAVVGMSGGVDSAVVSGILCHCPSLKRVIAVAAPISSKGATNQDVAATRAIRQANAFKMEVWKLDLTPAQFCYEGIMRCSPSNAEGEKRVWADGQILSIARTPLFYGVAAHLQAEGFRALVAGTTNRSEGSYIGFYGKGSDGMNDIQPISDLWKSHVFAMAEYLGVIPEIINEKPRGDVWDSRCDEEMIGASYPQIETYLEAKCKYEAELKYGVLNDNPKNLPGAKAIEHLHNINLHKYLVGSPAIHFDVFPRHVPGGWSEMNSYTHVLGKKYHES
jgi:NAD+ synthase (glutamine-hydrolysing)